MRGSRVALTGTTTTIDTSRSDAGGRASERGGEGGALNEGGPARFGKQFHGYLEVEC